MSDQAPVDEADDPRAVEIVRAERLGRLYARAGLSLSQSPYPWDGDPDTQVLRWCFAMAYADAGGIKLPRWETVKERVRRFWQDDEDQPVQE